MSNLRVKCHPTLGILVGTDGHVMVPANGPRKAHWTFGCPNSQGYWQVRIDRKSYLVHRLVAQTFLQYPIPQGCQIDHVNRDKSANFLSNLRIVTPSANRRNTADHDRVDARGGTHKYEDERQYMRERHASYYAENREKELERSNRYNQAKRKTHRLVRFADGSQHYVPHAEAEALLAIPLNQRIFKG